MTELQVQGALKQYCIDNLQAIASLLEGLNSNDYSYPSEWLFGSSIGQHTRHILEFYSCLMQGEGTGVVNYDHRQRDLNLEQQINAAIDCIANLCQQIQHCNPSQKLMLEVNHHASADANISIPSNMERELASCLEHSIHHQALIKTGLKELNKVNLVDKYFGVAPATIRHYKAVSESTKP